MNHRNAFFVLPAIVLVFLCQSIALVAMGANPNPFVALMRGTDGSVSPFIDLEVRPVSGVQGGTNLLNEQSATQPVTPQPKSISILAHTVCGTVGFAMAVPAGLFVGDGTRVFAGLLPKISKIKDETGLVVGFAAGLSTGYVVYRAGVGFVRAGYGVWQATREAYRFLQDPAAGCVNIANTLTSGVRADVANLNASVQQGNVATAERLTQLEERMRELRAAIERGNSANATSFADQAAHLGVLQAAFAQFQAAQSARLISVEGHLVELERDNRLLHERTFALGVQALEEQTQFQKTLLAAMRGPYFYPSIIRLPQIKQPRLLGAPTPHQDGQLSLAQYQQQENDQGGRANQD